MVPVGRLKKGGGDPAYLYIMFPTAEGAAAFCDAGHPPAASGGARRVPGCYNRPSGNVLRLYPTRGDRCVRGEGDNHDVQGRPHGGNSDQSGVVAGIHLENSGFAGARRPRPVKVALAVGDMMLFDFMVVHAGMPFVKGLPSLRGHMSQSESGTAAGDGAPGSAAPSSPSSMEEDRKYTRKLRPSRKRAGHQELQRAEGDVEVYTRGGSRERSEVAPL